MNGTHVFFSVGSDGSADFYRSTASVREAERSF